MSISAKNVNKLSHHEKKEICSTRAKYREGRRDTSVRVYTVNQESCYLLIQNVPSVGNREELKEFCEQYGLIDDIYPLDDYPSEEFTDVYLVKYSNFSSSRAAKKQLDNRSFFGGVLHVCYAPEFETVEETRSKLADRRRYIVSRTKSNFRQKEGNFSEGNKRKSGGKSFVGESKTPKVEPVQYMTYVWAGKEYTVPMSSSSSKEEAVNYDVQQAAKNKELINVPSSLNRDAGCDVEISEKPEKPNKNNSQFFVPRQLKTKGESSSLSIDVSNSEVKKDDPNLVRTDIGYPYDRTTEKIRQKLSSFSSANLAVNLKGKKS
ncbi:uncharacterized protein LOC111641838 [Centruroides sculpturatus]|uniref:uncharacterized protein LOC111641838 n=1 Tax=Centruroides sculpturatus TaxID=218467 RepID=UPI000C6CC288|nr:uncharacterized protein LOC111641838 [Centruroides sculpturatus]